MNELDDKERALLRAIKKEWGPGSATRDAVRAALPARLAMPSVDDAPAPNDGSKLPRGALGLGFGALALVAIGAFYSLRTPPPAPPVPTPIATVLASPPPAPTATETPAVSIDSLPNAVTPPPPPRAVAAKDEGSLAEELALIGAAQTSRRAGASADALKTLHEHAARFPNGAMRDERMTLEALVLCDEGNVAGARTIRDELARVSPGSSHLQRLSTSCAAP